MNQMQDMIAQLHELITPLDGIFSLELLVTGIWVVFLDSPTKSIPKSHKNVIFATAILTGLARVGYGLDHRDVLMGAVFMMLVGVFTVLGILVLISRTITLGKASASETPKPSPSSSTGESPTREDNGSEVFGGVTKKGLSLMVKV
jgi:hypothetical protein